MQEITLEELYEVMGAVGLVLYNQDNEMSTWATKTAITELLTDLNKLGYKIVKK